MTRPTRDEVEDLPPRLPVVALRDLQLPTGLPTGAISRHFKPSARAQKTHLQAFRLKRTTGFEPATFGLGSRRMTSSDFAIWSCFAVGS